MDRQSSSDPTDGLSESLSETLLQLFREETRLTGNLVDLARQRTERGKDQMLLSQELNRLPRADPTRGAPERRRGPPHGIVRGADQSGPGSD
jgi:hypothetical protein